MGTEPFEFISASGLRLSGHLDTPVATSRGWAIFAHCFTCGKSNLAATRVSRALALAGIGVLRFDFAGLGGSEGEFGSLTFASDVADIVAAGHAMLEAGMAPNLLVGHSLGGAAVLLAALDMPEIRAVVTIAAPAHVTHILQQFAPASVEQIAADGQAEVMLGGRPFTIGRAFIDDLDRHDVEACVARLHRPLLVMHAPDDDVVGIVNATRIFTAAKHPKSYVSLDSADHLLTKRADADYAASVIAAWASRYLPQAIADLTRKEDERGVSATETGAGTFQLEIRAGKQRFFADEPESVGGLGSGPGPFELVSAGLAACTTMTMRLYAQRKGWPLERARTTVAHSRRADTTPIDLFSRTITLEGPLDDGQRAAILAIADLCPVDLTLVRGSDVQTVLTPFSNSQFAALSNE